MECHRYNADWIQEKNVSSANSRKGNRLGMAQCQRVGAFFIKFNSAPFSWSAKWLFLRVSNRYSHMVQWQFNPSSADNWLTRSYSRLASLANPLPILTLLHVIISDKLFIMIFGNTLMSLVYVQFVCIVRSRIEGGVRDKGNLWDILFRVAKTLYLMNRPVDQANSGAKYEFRCVLWWK